MEQKKMVINFGVTIALLVVMASVAIIGISTVMEPFTSYYFNGMDEASKGMLLQMYGVLRNTRLIMIAVLFISVAIKSFQFLRERMGENTDGNRQ